MRPERPERLDMRPERLDLRPVKLDLKPERLNLRPERPDLRSQKPDLRPEGPDEGARGGRINKQTNKQTKVPLCSTGLRPLRGRYPKTGRPRAICGQRYPLPCFE